MKTEQYEVIVIGGGKGGKTLAIELGHKGVKTALIERSAEMIGGTCINLACIPTKSFIASARMAHAARNTGEYGIRTGETIVEWNVVRQRVDGIVAGMRAMNHKNFTSAPALEFIIGTGRFVEPHIIEVRAVDGGVRQLTAEKIFINTGTRPAQPSISGLGEVSALN